MLDPNDPRHEGILNERKTILQEPLRKERRDIWLEERVREFLENDRPKESEGNADLVTSLEEEVFGKPNGVVDLGSLEKEAYGVPDTVPDSALREDMPKKLSYAESDPLFWSAFLYYVGGTQRKPDTKENLALRFYRNREIRKELRFMQSRGEDIGDILHECVQEMRGKFALIDENDYYALLRQSQLPKDVPSGGLYDLPLDAYLRQKGWDQGKARRTHTIFTRYVIDTDPLFLIRSESPTQDVVKGYRVGILTVGSLVAFQQKYPIKYVYDLSDSTVQDVLGMVRRDTSRLRANR